MIILKIKNKYLTTNTITDISNIKLSKDKNLVFKFKDERSIVGIKKTLNKANFAYQIIYLQEAKYGKLLLNVLWKL